MPMPSNIAQLEPLTLSLLANHPPDELEPLLDAAVEALESSTPLPGFFDALARIRDQGTDDWKHAVELCRSHPVFRSFQEDPLTSRSMRRPRGYQGDADTLDLIYSRDPRRLGPCEVSASGLSTFEQIVDGDAARAVRMRKRTLAALLDETCLRRPDARVLSVACGHLREAEEAECVRPRFFERFVALDHDPITIGRLHDEKVPLGIEPVVGSVSTILRGRLTGPFTLIYSAGLYDYLDDAIARRLTARLFDLLEPGGRLVIANFMPDLVETAYMEAFMDWWLIYRDAAAVAELAAEIPSASVAKRRVATNENGTVAYLDVTKVE